VWVVGCGLWAVGRGLRGPWAAGLIAKGAVIRYRGIRQEVATS